MLTNSPPCPIKYFVIFLLLNFFLPTLVYHIQTLPEFHLSSLQMLHPNHLPTSSFFIITGLITLFHIPTSFSQSQENPDYVACGQNFECGDINVGYPFWGGNRPNYCGYPDLNLTCQDDIALLAFEPLDYRVLATENATQSLTVVRNDLLTSNTCPEFVYNDTLNSNILKYSSNVQNLSFFYGCTSLAVLPEANEFFCPTNGTEILSYFATSTALGFNTVLVSCNSTIVVQGYQGLNFGSLASLRKGIFGGFDLQWEVNNTICNNCSQSGGRCGYNSNSFVCYCADQSYDLTCNDTSSSSQNGGRGKFLDIILPIVGAVIAGVGLGWLIFYCRQRRKRRAADFNHLSSIDKKEHPTIPLTNTALNTPSSIASTKSTSSYPSSKTKVGRDSSYFGAKIFSYDELEEATGNFAQTRELGDGGFGAVYLGILFDGSIVAVKRLYENNYKRVEQFMNEVEILTRLRHSHLVTLYGCTSKQSRELLLVYEYISNGTIADHLHGKRANSGLLSWPIRLNIAIETADALAYLHASDIIHRDVKSNNILLDNDFHVKVADFGLSRLFPNDVTHVSTAPQGTPGYVDPEYYQVYRLTGKSDVYSFGVVLIELISSLPAVDITRHRHDVNLANMAVNKIQNHTLHELVDPSLQFEANSTVKRMITLVAELAFRCLQQEKDMRPSMQEVLDALQGIQNGSLNAQKGEVVDILVDDGRLLNDNSSPPSPNSVTYKWVSGSTKSSSG